MEYVLLGGRQPVDPAPLGEHGPVLEADDREGGLCNTEDPSVIRIYWV